MDFQLCVMSGSFKYCPRCDTVSVTESDHCATCRASLEIVSERPTNDATGLNFDRFGQVRCPHCGETAGAELMRCRECGSYLSPEIQKRFGRIQRRSQIRAAADKTHAPEFQPLPELGESEATDDESLGPESHYEIPVVEARGDGTSTTDTHEGSASSELAAATEEPTADKTDESDFELAVSITDSQEVESAETEGSETGEGDAYDIDSDTDFELDVYVAEGEAAEVGEESAEDVEGTHDLTAADDDDGFELSSELSGEIPIPTEPISQVPASDVVESPSSATPRRSESAEASSKEKEASQEQSPARSAKSGPRRSAPEVPAFDDPLLSAAILEEREAARRRAERRQKRKAAPTAADVDGAAAPAPKPPTPVKSSEALAVYCPRNHRNTTRKQFLGKKGRCKVCGIAFRIDQRSLKPRVAASDPTETPVGATPPTDAAASATANAPGASDANTNSTASATPPETKKNGS